MLKKIFIVNGFLAAVVTTLGFTIVTQQINASIGQTFCECNLNALYAELEYIYRKKRLKLQIESVNSGCIHSNPCTKKGSCIVKLRTTTPEGVSFGAPITRITPCKPYLKPGRFFDISSPVFGVNWFEHNR